MVALFFFIRASAGYAILEGSKKMRSYPLKEISKQNSHLLIGEAYIPFTCDATYSINIP